MSIKALNWAFGLDLKNTTQKFILVALADTADDFGVCWPSYETIAKKCSVSRRSVIRSINDLIKQGIITKTRRFKANGFNNSNCFHLKIGVEISDDHPLKEIVTESHPIVTDCHHPSDTVSPKPSLNHNIYITLTREKYLREIDGGYKSGSFKDFEHLTETEITHAASECWDFMVTELKEPKEGSACAHVRRYIREGIRRGKIRKAEKADTSQNATEGEQGDKYPNPLQTWHERIRPIVGEELFISWFRPMHWNGNGTLQAPTAFHAQRVKEQHHDAINQVLKGVTIKHQPYQPEEQPNDS
jgi:DNA-binding Lrp family transcriptional regulator